jgi:hypothetical protein
MKIAFQLMNALDGSRTETVIQDKEKMHTSIRVATNGRELDKIYVLIIGEVKEDGELELMYTPCFTVKTLLQGGQAVQNDIYRKTSPKFIDVVKKPLKLIKEIANNAAL